MPNPMIIAPGTGQPFVGIFNIGTGNCVSLYGNGGNPVGYTDYGFPLPFYISTYPGWTAGAPAPYPCVCSDPVMILSHWDYDHYSMTARVNASYQLRWIAPQQFMGPVSAATLYHRILRNQTAGVGNACLYLWPAGAAGHLRTPFGYVERGNGANPIAPGGRNDSGLITWVRAREAAFTPPTWPAIFNAPAAPVPGPGLLPPPALFGPLAPPTALFTVAGFPPFAGGDRYILLPGDCSYLNIPSLAGGPPAIVGMMATHHGSSSWLPGGVVPGLLGAIAAMGFTPAQDGWGVPGPPAPLMGGAIPGPAMPIPPAPPALPEPLAAAVAPPLVTGGRVAYSYGTHPVTGAHPYNHPRNEALLAYMLRGWVSRINTNPNDWYCRKWYYPHYPPPGAGGPPPGPPPYHRTGPPPPPGPPWPTGGVALGWQDNGFGVGTYLWRDIAPAGPLGPGGALGRNCLNCGQGYTFTY